MALGIVLAIMLAAAVLAVLWPLSRSGSGRAVDSDLAVYRDQLEEIERDRAAGLIGGAEAEAAHVEISRRLLRAAEVSTPVAKPGPTSQWRRRAAAVAALSLMPLGAIVLYLVLGSPALPGQPLAARLEARQDHSLDSMIARVEAHLAQQPDDGRGWEVIAPVYLRIGRYDDAVQADRNALKLLGETPQRFADLAQALMAQADGVVTAEAKHLFEQAAAGNPQEARSQFYLGLAAEQDGRPQDAARMWHALADQAPADAPWLPAVRQALARVEGTTTPAPGPNVDDMAAAAQMSPADRERMIHAMVERLAARLHDDGSDVEGWLRLIRAHMVLGEREQARAAAADARRALKDDPEKLRRIEDGAKSFGLDG